MKNTYYLAVLALAVTTSGCISYTARPVRTVVVTNQPVVETSYGVDRTIVTTLPVGYRVRVYRGNTYYVHRHVYYRSRPGGYFVVRRPW